MIRKKPVSLSESKMMFYKLIIGPVKLYAWFRYRLPEYFKLPV